MTKTERYHGGNILAMRCRFAPISSRSQGLKTVIPPIPNSTLRCDHPLALLSEPLAEPPDPHGDHYQAANGKSTGQNIRANGGTI